MTGEAVTVIPWPGATKGFSVKKTLASAATY